MKPIETADISQKDARVGDSTIRIPFARRDSQCMPWHRSGEFMKTRQERRPPQIPNVSTPEIPSIPSMKLNKLTNHSHPRIGMLF